MKRRTFLESSLLLTPLIAMPEKFFSFPAQNIPNVLILGDSISIGYTPFTKKLLAGNANVFRPVMENGSPENCEGTTNGLKNIDRWLNKTGGDNPVLKWDIIHFNFGLHDIKHVDPLTGKNSNNPKDPQQAPLKQYKKNLEIIIEKLKATGAALIFATTTPYPGKVTNPLRKPGMPAKYNRAAINIMNRHSITINDLYAFMLPRLTELQLPEDVHFTPVGYNALARKVVERIKEVIVDKKL